MGSGNVEWNYVMDTVGNLNVLVVGWGVGVVVEGC